MRKRNTKEDWIVDSVNYFLLAIVTAITLYPFYYLLLVSLNEGSDSAIGGMYLFPREFTIENYVYFFKDQRWLDALGVSIGRTVVGTGLSILFTSLVACGLAKSDLLFRRFYFLVVIIAMYVSGGLISYYVVLRGLGLVNSFGWASWTICSSRCRRESCSPFSIGLAEL